jgi:hypothetical protein
MLGRVAASENSVHIPRQVPVFAGLRLSVDDVLVQPATQRSGSATGFMAAVSSRVSPAIQSFTAGTDFWVRHGNPLPRTVRRRTRLHRGPLHTDPAESGCAGQAAVLATASRWHAGAGACAIINQRLQGDGFVDAEDVVFQALLSSSPKLATPPQSDAPPTKDIEELFAPLRGLNLDCSRNPSTGRLVNGYLFDTNIPSEFSRDRSRAMRLAAAQSQPVTTLFLSAVTNL